jgi:hypothetical protein
MGFSCLYANLGAVGVAATIIGSAMAFVDGTLTKVALPQIQRLGTTAVDAQ